jgi:hypothetical protein
MLLQLLVLLVLLVLVLLVLVLVLLLVLLLVLPLLPLLLRLRPVVHLPSSCFLPSVGTLLLRSLPSLVPMACALHMNRE